MMARSILKVLVVLAALAVGSAFAQSSVSSQSSVKPVSTVEEDSIATDSASAASLSPAPRLMLRTVPKSSGSSSTYDAAPLPVRPQAGTADCKKCISKS